MASCGFLCVVVTFSILLRTSSWLVHEVSNLLDWIILVCLAVANSSFYYMGRK